jgi:arginase
MSKVQKRPKTVEIIGVPLDLGANTRGATMGPEVIRIAGLKERIEALGYSVFDTGDIDVPIRESLAPGQSESRYLEPIKRVCEEVCEHVEAALSRGNIPITIGGDHSLAIGSIAGASGFFRGQKREIGLLWIDAHADMNTPKTSPSGNIHGMPLAVALGRADGKLASIGGKGPKIKPENVALIGIRDIDEIEKRELRECGIRYFTMREIDERGKYAVMKEALEIVSSGTDGIHVSCDIDGVDPLYAPGVSTPVPGGLSFREIHLALEMLADSRKLCSMDLVEFNPLRDRDFQTAELAVGLVLSALGKSIV